MKTVTLALAATLLAALPVVSQAQPAPTFSDSDVPYATMTNWRKDPAQVAIVNDDMVRCEKGEELGCEAVRLVIGPSRHVVALFMKQYLFDQTQMKK